MSDDPDRTDDDERLLAELGAAVREARAVPEGFVAGGKAAFAWRTVDTELARLLTDTAVAEPEAAGMRGDRGGRALSFASSDLSIELELHPDAVRGQLAPAQPGAVMVRAEAGPVREVAVDDVGWFVVRPVPPGRFRLHVRTTTGASVLTDWIDPRR